MNRSLLTIAFLTALIAGLASATPAQAQERTRCFEETGYCVSGSILDYWEANGGLPVFGYPITEQRTEEVEYQELSVQWFERDRLEIQPDGTITAGRLGARLLGLRGTPWRGLPQVDSAPPGCVFFPETNHSLCEPFLSYWQQNGGLERFGYPLSEPREETIRNGTPWTGTVQWFERRRMEHHTDLPGTPVLLGLLGRAVLEFPTGVEVACAPEADVVEGLAYHLREGTYERTRLGCPRDSIMRNVEAAEQYYERGVMVYARTPSFPETGIVYAIITEPLPLRYMAFPNTWSEQEPEDHGDLTPPEGLVEPKRGFGKVWYQHENVREALGWATGPETPHTATVQSFERGTVIWLMDTDFVYVIFGDRDLSEDPTEVTASPRETLPGE